MGRRERRRRGGCGAYLASPRSAGGGCGTNTPQSEGGWGTNTPQSDGGGCCFFLERQMWKGVCFLGVLDGLDSPGSPGGGSDSGIFWSASSTRRSDAALSAARPLWKSIPGLGSPAFRRAPSVPAPSAGSEDRTEPRQHRGARPLSGDLAQRPRVVRAAQGGSPGEACASGAAGEAHTVPRLPERGSCGAATPTGILGNCVS